MPSSKTTRKKDKAFGIGCRTTSKVASPTSTNAVKKDDTFSIAGSISQPPGSQLCAASRTIAQTAKKKPENLSTGTNSKRQKLFNGVNFDIPGEDVRRGTDGWWRRCRRKHNDHGAITTEWCFWHDSMKLKSIRSVKQALKHGTEIGFPFIGSQRSDKPINIAQHFIHAQQISRIGRSRGLCTDTQTNVSGSPVFTSLAGSASTTIIIIIILFHSVF